MRRKRSFPRGRSGRKPDRIHTKKRVRGPKVGGGELGICGGNKRIDISGEV